MRRTGTKTPPVARAGTAILVAALLVGVGAAHAAEDLEEVPEWRSTEASIRPLLSLATTSGLGYHRNEFGSGGEFVVGLRAEAVVASLRNPPVGVFELQRGMGLGAYGEAQLAGWDGMAGVVGAGGAMVLYTGTLSIAPSAGIYRREGASDRPEAGLSTGLFVGWCFPMLPTGDDGPWEAMLGLRADHRAGLGAAPSSGFAVSSVLDVVTLATTVALLTGLKKWRM